MEWNSPYSCRRFPHSSDTGIHAMSKEQLMGSGYIVLKVLRELTYRGVDREPFEPLVTNEVIDHSDATPFDEWEVFTLYPPGWRREAYRLFSRDNATYYLDGDFLLINTHDVASSIRSNIPESEGRYEVLKCNIFMEAPHPGDSAKIPYGLVGYDVAYPGGDYYSAILNGLFVNPHPELVERYSSMLNINGLFGSTEHLEQYLTDFKRLVPSEVHAEFVVVELVESEGVV